MKKSIEFVNYDYILKEMKESMKTSIENVKKVITQQEELVALIKDNNKEENMKEFIIGIEEQTKQYKEQLRILNYRLECLTTLLSTIEDTTSKYVISMLLESIGMANQQAKSLQERKDNKEEIDSF